MSSRRAYLCSDRTASAIDNRGGSQFFPSIYPGAAGSVHVAFSQVNLLVVQGSTTNSYDQWLVHGSTADIRGLDPNYATLDMDGMVSA